MPAADPLRSAVVSGALGGCVLVYLDWYWKRLSPALANSRLAALQARIRPHFLFNSLNTAISVVRHDAALAETVLLVEEDPDMKVVLEDSLAARGYRVLHADDGLDAFALICSVRARIDVIVSDRG